MVGVVFLFYGQTLFADFILDDLRNLRLFREYAAGQRASLDLYGFLPGGEANVVAREAGWYSWWIGEELRYRHWRPASEWFLYYEYLLFGQWAPGFRLVGLGLYAVGVCLLLPLFRLVGGGERRARWGALLFSLAACHAIPVTFVSAHCDVLALISVVGAMVMVGRYVRDGGVWRALAGAALYGVGLCTKEAVLPVVLVPVCLGLAFAGTPGRWRRAFVAVGAFAVVAAVWFGCYVSGGYGSNAMLMQDPIHMPLDYLAALPGRAVLLLSTWLIPVNSFLFRFHHGWSGWLSVYVVVGAVALGAACVMYWCRHRGDRGVLAMAVWAILFMPLLVCTVPDDRVMMLPSIGFAYLGAAWLAHPRPGRRFGLRRLPFVLFIVLQGGAAWATTGVMHFMEYEARRHLLVMVAAFGRDVRAGDQIFMLNTARNFEALMAQYRLCHVLGREDVRVSVLSDIARPKVPALPDRRTIRLETRDVPFFSSFLGLMGTSRDRPRRAGDVYTAGTFRGVIREVDPSSGAVRVVELEFDKDLRDESYRFFWSDSNEPPALWAPGSRATMINSRWDHQTWPGPGAALSRSKPPSFRQRSYIAQTVADNQREGPGPRSPRRGSESEQSGRAVPHPGQV